MQRILFVLAVLFLFAAQLSAEELVVELRFEPTVVLPLPGKIVADVKNLKGVRIHPFTDKRSVGETFLGQVKLNGQVQTIQSKTAVAGFITDAFAKVYGEWGGTVSPDGPLDFKGEITQFEFVENESYQAKIGVHFFLLGDRGRILWDGHSAGVVKGAGKTIGAEYISALFSDLLRATYMEMLEDDKLVGVWSGRVSNTYLIKDAASAAVSANSGG